MRSIVRERGASATSYQWARLAEESGTYYLLTSAVVVCGVSFGVTFIKPSDHPMAKEESVVSAFANWDGEWFTEIARNGYSYNPDAASSVAFFPGYPVAGRIVMQVSGLRAEVALVLTAHLFLLASFVALLVYARERLANRLEAAELTVLAFGLLPPTFFFRMAYSESLFILLTILALWGMERRWSLAAICIIVGAATATRTVGVALFLPLAAHVWQRYPSIRAAGTRLLWAMPVAGWGLAGYIFFLLWEFDEPLAFAQTQKHWLYRPAMPTTEKMLAYFTWEPLWSVYESSSPAYWKRIGSSPIAFCSLQFANAFYFLLSASMIAVGYWRGWLTRYEILLAVPLLAIPYFTRGYDVAMAAHARYAAGVFPVYIVIGQLLSRIPQVMTAGVLSLCGFFLGLYSAMFSAWYLFI